MPDTDDAETKTRTDRNQLIAAVILGLAATLTAVAAYSAALADGEALEGYTNSTRTLNDANAFFAQGQHIHGVDQSQFLEYADAVYADDAARADYLTTLMRPELKDAVEWWQETDEAVTPFDELEGNPYAIEDFGVAHELEDEAAVQFDQGVDADEQGDVFELAVVFFALALFFGGIATVFDRQVVVTALFGIAAGVLVFGSVIYVLAL